MGTNRPFGVEQEIDSDYLVVAFGGVNLPLSAHSGVVSQDVNSFR